MPTYLQRTTNRGIIRTFTEKSLSSLLKKQDESSVFRNPSSPHGDRELLELCANGTVVTAVGLTMSGTSFAAPAVAEITALIQEANSTLQVWPEGCRAILLASANRSVTGGTWWNDVSSGIDSKDGAGAANAYNSYAITENRVSRNGIAQRGWDIGTLSSRDFDSNRMSTFTYRVRTPIFGWSPFARVKISLAWDSEVRIGGFPPSFSSNLTLDLDLLVYDATNNLVGSSESWDNSYEIVEFTPRAKTTYTIKIRRWSGTNDTWFGIAWNVYGFLFVDPGFNVAL
jgi:subtilase family protein